ncbi:hypothetical protein [Paenibacillus sp. FSL H8-0537]|uniref:hypothetical protein n=1 Tax=Paenibacillus sp. FSL H8-0537 TaxID=2921399 RepID=UPI0031013A63
MKNLSIEQFAKSREFMMSQGRELEKALFKFEFESGSTDNVVMELTKYQNYDGGFGKGLEPDLRCDVSSVLATTTALQILSGMKVSREHESIAKAINYLANQYSREHMGWEIIPVEADEAPRAIWWNYQGHRPQWGNPNAEVLGYLYQYNKTLPDHIVKEITVKAEQYLDNCEELEMHEIYCYLRLAERMSGERLNHFTKKLEHLLDLCVVVKQEDRKGYCATPLQVVDSPESLFYHNYSEVIPADLDEIITNQTGEGSWQPNWNWGRFEEEWKLAEKEWAGIITLNTLKTLRAFNRISD